MASGTTLGKAYIQIVPSMEGTKNSILGVLNKDAGDAGEKAGGNAGKKLASSIKSKALSFAKSLGIGQAVLGTITEAFNQGAQLKQNLGGIETLFKGSADKMKEYAKNAYMTAGISANEYMQQATAFSASLISSLGGDTEKAAEYANRAMLDMSDNANKMGTSMESVQNAYQGFAKGNYTMLDNLKLGFGGTKEEMQRLIAETSQMTDIQNELNVSVKDGDISFGNIVNAISVMQKHLDITGTTAKEASTTFSGSIGMMKASWTNFLSALMMSGKDGVNVIDTLKPLIESINTFVFNNLLPAIGRIIVALPPVIGSLIMEQLPILASSMQKTITGLIDTIKVNLPQFLDKGLEIVDNMLTGFLNNAPNMITSLISLVTDLVSYLLQSLPQFLARGKDLVINLVNGLVANFPNMLSAMVTGVHNLIATIASNLPQFLVKGGEIIGQLLSGLLQAIPNLISSIPGICKRIWDSFISYDWLALGRNILQGIGNGITSAITGLVDGAIRACKTLADNVKSFFGIHSPSRLFAEYGEYLDAGLAQGITNNIGIAEDAIDTMNKAVVDSVDMNPSVGLDVYGQVRTGSKFTNDTTAYGTNVDYGGVTINVYARDNKSAKEVAKEVEKILTKKEEFTKRGALE